MHTPRDPISISLLTYAWVIALSSFGGLASFLGKYRRGEVRAINITELVGELVISAFAGIITYYLCTWSQLDPMLTAALVGICGHMGSRAVLLAEQRLRRIVDRMGPPDA